MEVTTRIDSEANLRIHTMSGRVTREELTAKLREIYTTPGFQPDMNSLWDCRAADFSAVQAADIQLIRDLVEEHWGTAGKSRSALIVATDLDFGISRIYEFYVEDTSTNQVRVFRDYEEAYDWVTSSALAE